LENKLLSLDKKLKRIFDVLLALFFLLAGSPLFVLIVFLVKLSSIGSVFYIQERIGHKYKSFGCIKFRTMYSEADNILSSLLEKSESLRDEFERDFKLRKDPRITPIGRLLRRSSLDELPQLINVIRGDMSIVGPRPIVEAEVPRYGKDMDEVISVRPGMTGLWQVSGRNNLSYKRRVELDLIYVRQRSLVVDLRIIIRTFGVLLLPMDRGAY
tara:strand:- start:1500 stop:2138 length:639 start_codon:yes stop_codon:yes gene_type:complete